MSWLVAVSLLMWVATGCEREDWKPDRLAYRSYSTEDATIKHGRQAYKTYCVGCHGEAGDGTGPAARFLEPKPRDFTSGVIKFAAVEAGQLPHNEDLERVIRRGLHGTSMPAWRFLPEETLGGLVAYVKSFAADEFANDEPHARIVAAEDPWAGWGEKKAVRKGAAIYHALALCSNCHPSYLTKQEVFDLSKAEYGSGTTSFREDPYAGVVTSTDWGDELAAPDFLTAVLKNGTGIEDVYRVIVSGIGGTAMPTWRGALPEEQLWALAYYVQSIALLRGTTEAKELAAKLASQAPFDPVKAKAALEGES